MKIKYETDSFYCLTLCPHGINCYVGSGYCYNCENFVDGDSENNIVICKGGVND